MSNHPVTSRAIGAARPYRPQVIPRGCMANAAIVMLWLVALVLLASLTEANAVVSDFVTAWQRQQVHVTVMDERPQLAAESKTARVRALAQELGKSESTVWRLIRSGELSLEEG